MVVPGLGASSLIASTLGIFGTGIWMVPLLLGTVNYYRYDRVDPESRPIDQKQLYSEYDYIVIGGENSLGARHILLSDLILKECVWSLIFNNNFF